MQLAFALSELTCVRKTGRAALGTLQTAKIIWQNKRGKNIHKKAIDALSNMKNNQVFFGHAATPLPVVSHDVN